MILALSLCMMCFAGCGTKPATTTEDSTTGGSATEGSTTGSSTTEASTTKEPSRTLLTADEYYEKAKEEFAKGNLHIDDLTPLVELSDTEMSYTAYLNRYKVLLGLKDGYVTDVTVECSDEQILQWIADQGEAGLVIQLQNMASSIAALDDSRDATDLIAEFLVAEGVIESDVGHRRVDYGDWSCDLTAPRDETYIKITAHYNGD